MKALLVIKDCCDAVDGEDTGLQAAGNSKSMKAKALMLAGVESIWQPLKSWTLRTRFGSAHAS
jgi:hypothetical protein